MASSFQGTAAHPRRAASGAHMRPRLTWCTLPPAQRWSSPVGWACLRRNAGSSPGHRVPRRNATLARGLG
eukprot:10164095-Alexandrium_andersonii.AAC.1